MRAPDESLAKRLVTSAMLSALLVGLSLTGLSSAARPEFKPPFGHPELAAPATLGTDAAGRPTGRQSFVYRHPETGKVRSIWSAWGGGRGAQRRPHRPDRRHSVSTPALPVRGVRWRRASGVRARAIAALRPHSQRRLHSALPRPPRPRCLPRPPLLPPPQSTTLEYSATHPSDTFMLKLDLPGDLPAAKVSAPRPGRAALRIGSRHVHLRCRIASRTPCCPCWSAKARPSSPGLLCPTHPHPPPPPPPPGGSGSNRSSALTARSRSSWTTRRRLRRWPGCCGRAR